MNYTKCDIGIELQEKGSPHVYLFISIFDAPNIQNKDNYISCIEKTINAQLSYHLNDPEQFKLVKTYWFMITLGLGGNTARMNVDFAMVNICYEDNYFISTCF